MLANNWLAGAMTICRLFCYINVIIVVHSWSCFMLYIMYSHVVACSVIGNYIVACNIIMLLCCH